MKDEIMPWHSAESFEGVYLLKELHFADDQLVLLEGEDAGRRLTMRIDGLVMYHRQLYGAARSLAWGGRKAPEGTFFVVKGSSVSEDLLKQACGLFKIDDLVHFRVAAENCVLDIVTGLEPEIVEGDLLEERRPQGERGA